MKCQHVKLGNGIAIVCTSRERKVTLKFPAARDAMLDAGYRDTGKNAICASCGAPMEWWITPADNWIPITKLASGRLQPHHIDCPDARRYREANRNYKVRTENPKPSQGQLFK